MAWGVECLLHKERDLRSPTAAVESAAQRSAAQRSVFDYGTLRVWDMVHPWCSLATQCSRISSSGLNVERIQQNSSVIKAPAGKPGDQAQFPEPTWWKETTDYYGFSDFRFLRHTYMYTHIHIHTHAYTHICLYTDSPLSQNILNFKKNKYGREKLWKIFV